MSARLIHPFAEQGHFTAVHNLAFDLIMPRVSDSAWKVLCFILRQTIGYGRKSESLSFDDIKAGTGIKSDTTIRKAVAELSEGESFNCPLILKQEAAERGISRRAKTRYAINRKFALSLQKMRGEINEFRPSENEGRKKVRPSENGAYRPSDNEGRKTEHIGSARNLTEQSNKTSNSLSPREAIENDNDFEPPEINRMPFVEGEPDDRFQSPHFVALCEICKVDPALVSWETKTKTAAIATQLSQKYTPEQIRRAGERWELPTTPYPRQILDRIAALLSENIKARPAPPPPLSEFQQQREARRAERAAKHQTPAH